MMNKACVFDIQRSSMDDGPGIRTTVFLKGCPLRCKWCHNPESFVKKPQVVTLPKSGERKIYGQEMSAEAVLAIVKRDQAFYESSGGGVTVSGGEPLLWPEFLQELFRGCHEHGISTAIETSGAIPMEIWSALLPYIDLFLYDFKAFPEERHMELTGGFLEVILNNLLKLIRKKKAIILRCPLILGQNITDAYLQKIAELSRDYNLRVNLEPYHNTARDKWHGLGLDYELSALASMTRGEAQVLQERIIAFGAERNKILFT